MTRASAAVSRIRFRRCLFAGKIRIALCKRQRGVADYDSCFPEEILFDFLRLVLQEIVDMRLSFGPVEKHAFIKYFVEVVGIRAVSEVAAGQVRIFQMGGDNIARPVSEDFGKHFIDTV